MWGLGFGSYDVGGFFGFRMQGFGAGKLRFRETVTV